MNAATANTQVNVLLVGDTSTPDLAGVGVTVRALVAGASLRTVDSVVDLGRVLEEDWSPEVVIVAQNWPDEYPTTEVQSLMRALPLARFYCCYGPWCDSDGRTRDLWPLAIRIPAASAGARLQRELPSLLPSRPLPWTASRSEIFDDFCARPASQRLSSLRVSLMSPDRAWYDMWLCALRRAGCQILSANELSRAQALLWDADPWDEVRASQLSSLHQRFPQIKILAAVGFYRADLAAELKNCGATLVVGKLASLNDTMQTLITGPSAARLLAGS